MKSNKLIILFIFVFNIVFSQEKIDTTIAIDSTTITKDSTLTKINYDKWSIQIGAGVSNAIRPYTYGYYASSNNQLFNDFKINCYTVGGRYNFTPNIGLKADVSFDHFTNEEDSRSKPFETAQYRASIQGVFNLNSLVVKTKNNPSRFNLLFHAGFNLALLYPISSDYNPKVSSNDGYGGFVFGITPTIRIAKKISLFLDLSSFNNYGQNLAWNGKHSHQNNNGNGQMVSGTFGLSLNLDKKQQ